MIIQLKGMSFNSDVVFGKAIELTDETKALFGVGGYTKSLTDNQKILLQSMIESLQSEGLWDKIGKLYIPCLAGTDGEAFLDVKSSYGNGTNIIDTVGNGVTVTVEGNHVNIGGEISDRNTSTGIDYTVSNIQDFHVGVLFEAININLGTLRELSTFSITAGSANGISPIAFQGNAIFLNSFVNGQSDAINTNENTDMTYPMIMSFIDSTYKCGYTYGNVSGEITYQEIEKGSSWQQNYDNVGENNKLVFFRNWGNKVSTYHQIQFITVGKKLTENENKKYSQVVHDFITSVFA